MLQQYHLAGTYYGMDPATGQLVAFANMDQLRKYFPSGIQNNAPNLPASVNVSSANASPGHLFTISQSTPPPTPAVSSQGLQMPPGYSASTPTPIEPRGPAATPVTGGEVLAQSTQQVPLSPGQLDLSRGDQFLFTFPATHGNTVYLYDKGANIYIPFTSEQAFLAKTGETIQQAQASGQIHTLTNPADSASIIRDDKGIGDDGNFIDLSHIQNNYNVSGNTGGPNYGQPENPKFSEEMSQDLGSMASLWLNQLDITQQTFDNVVNNATNHALYVSALAYGGYHFDDVFRDIKAKELGLNTPAISPTMKAEDFYKTPQHLAAANNSKLDPTFDLNFDSAFYNTSIFNIPAKAFSALVPPLDKNSQEYKDAVSKISDQYHDTVLQMAEADTEEKHQIAQQSFDTLKKQVQETFGLTLSNDTQAAWGQIQQLGNTSNESRTLGSGMYNEALDSALAQQRKNQSYQRSVNTNQVDNNNLQHYTTNASPSEVAALTPEQRQQYGLAPSQDLLNYINNLQTTYPDISPTEIKAIRDSLIDPNGNLYSSLYRGMAKTQFDTTRDKRNYQEAIVQGKADLSEQKAYAPYSQAENPYSQYAPTTQSTAAVPPPTTASSPAPTPASPTGLQMPTGAAAQSTFYSAPPQALSAQPQGLQMPTNTPIPTQTAPSVPAPSVNDLSSGYGLYNNTVYNLKTGAGYSSPDQFFKDSGATSFNGIKLKNDYTPAFYKYDNDPTIFNTQTNQGIPDLNSYYNQGGAKDFSNVVSKGKKTATTNNSSYYA